MAMSFRLSFDEITYIMKLLYRSEVADGTMAFYFEKPKDFQFEPGQFADLTLIDPQETDAEGNRRSFSIASPPHEEGLMFATRMRDTAFKRVLRTLPFGTDLQLEGPYGGMTLDKAESRTAVFLAGGIGITPFRSMILEASKQKSRRQLWLFYSNRRLEDAPFLGELVEIQKSNSNYRLIPTLTQPEGSRQTWTGETGYINSAMLEKYLGSLTSAIYYTAGPPAMVAAMLEMLGKTGVQMNHIRSEEFSGY
jgi:ferredoxin-NADP reductase